MVTPGYFAAMGIPIVRGRGLSDADRRGALKVMVISEALAHAAFPDQIRSASASRAASRHRTGNPRLQGCRRRRRRRAFARAGRTAVTRVLSADRSSSGRGLGMDSAYAYIAVRTTLDPQAMAEPVRRIVSEIAPGVPVFQVRTMEERLRQSMATARFNTMPLTLLGIVGLVLAAIGVYGDRFRHATHAGDRRPRRARRNANARARTGVSPGSVARWAWARRRHQHVRGDAGAVDAAIRRHGLRSTDICCGRGDARRSRVRSKPDPGEPRVIRRSY